MCESSESSDSISASKLIVAMAFRGSRREFRRTSRLEPAYFAQQSELPRYEADLSQESFIFTVWLYWLISHVYPCAKPVSSGSGLPDHHCPSANVQRNNDGSLLGRHSISQ
jgi:hypothetical protein